MSQEQRDRLDDLIDRTARSMVAGDVPQRTFTTTLAGIDAGVERRQVALWPWGMGITATAVLVLAVSLLWKDATPRKESDTRPRQDVVATAVTTVPVEEEASPAVEPRARGGVRARRVEPRIPRPVTVEPVSIAVVEVGGVAIASVEVGHVEVARVELEPTRVDIVQ